MNQKAYESLRDTGMEEAQAVIIAEHTNMADVLAALVEQRSELNAALARQEAAMTRQGYELRLEMSELKSALT